MNPEKNLNYQFTDMKKWYNEYNGHWRIHDYFSLMINQFPIVVVRRMDNPHSENDDMDKIIMVGIIGFTWVRTVGAVITSSG